MRLSVPGAIAAVFIAGNAIAASGEKTAGHASATPSLAAAHDVTLPVGTRLPIVLDDTVGSDISRREQPVHAHLSRAVAVRGETVLPPGSRLTGVVTNATRSAKVKGRAHVALRFTSVASRKDGERYPLQAAPVGRSAAATKRKDAIAIGAPAAGGAIIGGLLGGKHGALIGTAVGAGGGTAVVLTTRGKEVRLPKGTALSLRLASPLTVRVGG